MKIDLEAAKRLLLEGSVVAIPTETVYGLGGWIHSEVGLNKIFSVKERPFFDPLIVHVDGIESAKELTSEWTEVHEVLAKSCWPGPLTLIAKKNEKVSPLITSGLDSVGLRCPNHPLTLELLKSIRGGVAAPSANKFGKTSPTSFQHVEDEFKGEVAIIDGGASEVGIGSTVAGVEGNEVRIYRPGFYTAQMLQKILLKSGLKTNVIYTESPVAPGQLKHHYMPKIPLIIVPEGFHWEDEKYRVEKALNSKFFQPILWKQNSDVRKASRELYEMMRSFDSQGFDLILAEKSSDQDTEDWLGIWNRLNKAQTSWE